MTIPWLVGAIFLKAGGILSDRLYKKTGSGRIARANLIWVTQALAGTFFILLSFADSLWMATLFLSLGLGFGLMAQPALADHQIHFFSIGIYGNSLLSKTSSGRLSPAKT
ncbi:MAG: hypothetical protein LLF94_08825 [Chlamydiales bacterium]|nr:hypothetical protein [Chlamydiales bacterium]